jgi:hypothetical protein
MSLDMRCQLCKRVTYEWALREAFLRVGRIEWKYQACRDCSDTLEKAITEALAGTERTDPA